MYVIGWYHKKIRSLDSEQFWFPALDETISGYYEDESSYYGSSYYEMLFASDSSVGFKNWIVPFDLFELLEEYLRYLELIDGEWKEFWSIIGLQEK